MSDEIEEIVDRLVAAYAEAASQVLGFDEQTMRNLVRVDLVESAVASVFQGYYTDVETRAGRLLIGLIRNHPLPDGNKRCAWVTTRFYLLTEGYPIRPDTYRAYDVLLSIADGDITDAKVIEWLDDLMEQSNEAEFGPDS